MNATPRRHLAALVSLALLAALVPGQDRKADAPWAMFGGSPSRNLVNTADKNIPDAWSVARGKEKNLKWAVPLGTMSYGGPVVAGGRIFIGTNNERPRDPKIKGDRGILLCLDEATGRLLWQAVHDKLPNPAANDVEKHGVASTPAVDGDRLYYVSNRCELICADVAGDGKGGPKFYWKLDMIATLGVYPNYLANSSPLIIGDLVFALTANGLNHATQKVENPKAPALVAVNKKTGQVVWKDNSPGEDIMDGQWSSPAAAQVDGQWQVIYGGGDGWLRGLDAATGKLLWKFDCNPKAAVFKHGGRGDRNFVIATPVVHDGKVYVAVGQDPDGGPGVGHLWCVDLVQATAKGKTNPGSDVSSFTFPILFLGTVHSVPVLDPRAAANRDSALVWHYGGDVSPKPQNGDREIVFGRSISTVAIHDGLVYAAELSGYLHCLDAKTGKKHWEIDLKDGTWASPYYVAGKVLIGVESGDIYVFKAGPNLMPPVKIDMEQPLKMPPVAANGVLYISNGLTLYAIAAK
jgi:outer membrane protein assembly factor BamB